MVSAFGFRMHFDSPENSVGGFGRGRNAKCGIRCGVRAPCPGAARGGGSPYPPVGCVRLGSPRPRRRRAPSMPISRTPGRFRRATSHASTRTAGRAPPAGHRTASTAYPPRQVPPARNRAWDVPARRPRDSPLPTGGAARARTDIAGSSRLDNSASAAYPRRDPQNRLS